MSTDIRSTSAQRQRRNLAHLGKVSMEAVVELNRRTMPFKELRQLQVGDVSLTSKLVGEAFILRINGAPFAEGATTMTGDQLTLRLTRLLAPPTPEANP